MDETWKTIVAIAGSLLAIGGGIGSVLHWHFKAINDLKDKIHDLEVKFIELKGKDDLQQTTIDRLSELFPALHKAVENIITKKGK